MIYIKKLSNKNANKKYLSWMKDQEVHEFTEQRYEKFSIKKIKKFICDKNRSKHEFLYGIFLKDNDEHIGNIKLGPINFHHKRSEVSYFIGERKYWGCGYAHHAIIEIIRIAKKKKIKKLKAGCYSKNKSSIKVLKKCKFKIEGKLKSEIIYKKRRITGYIFGLLI